MANHTVTLETELYESMELRASEHEQAEAPRAGSMKFTYASGSRPLDGYTIKRGVGRGGFGEVYFATSDAGKEVALKLIRRNLEVELRGVTQCLNLKHPNLIDLYDIRTDDYEDRWVVMEYVSGETLDQVIDRNPQGMPEQDALWWIRGTAAGVGYLHDHGIVHRDLKPGNIFSDEGMVKVGDYGLAKFISCSRRSGQTESVGTVHYMAPEIANGRYGREIDTYALGIILYETLTGRVPFEGESVGEVLMKHLTAEPDLSQLNQPYRDIVRRALAKDPEIRIKSVDEMLEMLPASDVAAKAGSRPFLDARPSQQPAAGADRPAGGPTLQPATQPAAPDDANIDLSYPEEPILRALRDGWDHAEESWHKADLHPFWRGALTVGVVFVLLSTVTVWVPTLFVACFVYAIYYAARAVILQPGKRHRRQLAAQQNSAANLSPHDSEQTVAYEATAHPPQRPRGVRRNKPRPNWRNQVQQELAAQPLREKLSQLLGSMLMAALVATLVALIAPVVFGVNGPSERMAMHVWLTLVGTLGAWAVLIPTKFAEGRLEDQVPMRFVLLVLGAGVGAAAWGLSEVMMIGIPFWNDMGVSPRDSFAGSFFNLPNGGQESAWMTADHVRPDLGVFVAYFAFLFVLVRWWRQAEYTRNHRLSLWAIAMCVFWAYCLHFFWWFPQPVGMMIAGVIATSTQLASPWLPPSRRRVLTEGSAAA